jgi:hypothetical protein
VPAAIAERPIYEQPSVSYHIRVRSHTPNYHASTDATADAEWGLPDGVV